MDTYGQAATYLLPIRRDAIEDMTELTDYLAWLSREVEVIVVDGSPTSVFEYHHRAWSQLSRHVRPVEALRSANGKAWGVNSGFRIASYDKVIIGDDDVRYDAESLRRLIALLDRAEVVRPQNYFAPAPWHALWDSGRILLNRSVGGDWPGTLGVRTHLIEGYDGDVLFENLELCRTIEAAGGRHLVADDLYVRRLPPAAKHFWSQRVRQAFDEFARPPRLVAQLTVVPALLLLAALRRPRSIAAIALLVAGLAEYGRRRAGGTAYFSPLASMLAPIWLLERGATSWLAVWERLRFGGVRYSGGVLQRAANSPATLRRTTRISPRAPVSPPL